MTERASDLPDIGMPIDDCWNRIGTRGDQSCPALAEWTRCLNCPVFERAAARLLDRPLADAADAAGGSTPRGALAGRADDEPGGAAGHAQAASANAWVHANGAASSDTRQASEAHSVVVFRVADEWLALPTSVLRQIEDLRPIHALPHRRNRVVLGLVNVRGALTVAVSLGELLRVEPGAAKPATHTGTHAAASTGSRSGAYARMLVAAHQCEPVALPVDEVHGVVRYADDALKPVPDTLTRASAMHAAGVLMWRGRTVGVLDAARVFASLTQSLQ
jgi:chemotaxis-related protein WspD